MSEHTASAPATPFSSLPRSFRYNSAAPASPQAASAARTDSSNVIPRRARSVSRQQSLLSLLVGRSVTSEASTFGGRYRDEQEATRAHGDPASWSAALDVGSRAVLSPRQSKRRQDVDEHLEAASPSNTITEEPVSYEAAEREAPNEAENPEGQEDDGSSVPTDPLDEPFDAESEISEDSSHDGDAAASRRPMLDRIERDVLKCVLSYFLAELWTFVPFLSDLVGAPLDVDGPVRNAHVIATVAVYFNPAKTRGAMLEADFFVFIGTIYAVSMCCSSMAVTVFLDRLGYEVLAHYLVLTLWLGGGFAAVAFAKVKVNKPTFTTATSLISLITCVIVTKESAYHVGRFDADAIAQIVIIVVIGALISNVVSFAVWPSSATIRFHRDLNKTLNSFSTLLDLLVRTFTMDDHIMTKPSALQSAIDAHQSSFTNLRSSLTHASFEFYDLRMAHTRTSYAAVVSSMTKLAQGLTGMRSGLALQYEIRKARTEGWHMVAEEEILHSFLGQAGASLDHLAWTCKRVLALLRISIEETKQQGSPVRTSADELRALHAEFEQALVLFRRVHNRAIKILYQRSPSSSGQDDPFSDKHAAQAGKDDAGTEDHRPNEDLFRIYYFCFNLEDWTQQLLLLNEAFISVRTAEEQLDARFAGKSRVGKVKTWLRAVLPQRSSKNVSWRRRLASLFKPFSLDNNPFPRIGDYASTSHRVIERRLSRWERLKRYTWELGHRLRQPDLRFAIKTGAGLALLAWPAFTSFRPLWLKWRGEWALISYMVIMSPSIGATNFLAFGRILGTALGALVAVICVSLFPENAIVLPFLGALFSVPAFYVIVTRPSLGPSSRFVLLTFNLTALYTYNLRLKDVDVVSIATHRFVAVAVGVLWALVVNTYVWPYEGRKAMRKGLTEFLLNAAHLYQMMVASYSAPSATLDKKPIGDEANERSRLLSDEARVDLVGRVEEFEQMELHLQLSLIRLNGLLAATKHEPRLKGPFPMTQYRQILVYAQNILDLLVSMRVTTTREAFITTIRREFVVPVNEYRREMVGNVLLYYNVLAAAFELKAPMSPFLPPAAQARARLVAALYELPVVKRRIVRGGAEALLYLGYVLVLKDVITNLEKLGETCQGLFGVAGSQDGTTSTFETFFRSA